MCCWSSGRGNAQLGSHQEPRPNRSSHFSEARGRGRKWAGRGWRACSKDTWDSGPGNDAPHSQDSVSAVLTSHHHSQSAYSAGYRGSPTLVPLFFSSCVVVRVSSSRGGAHL
ncbi:hypothetical protein LEMLEM_LOCUS17632 [Lemmus lemmus]